MKGGREDVDTPFWSCQGLVDQNDRGKALVSEKSHFLKETFFRGLRLSLGHFGQQAPKSRVSQLQKSVSTSSLPPFIVHLWAFQDYPRSNSFFQWETLKC